jgi:CRISPR/Cas system CSM-associated protein Csm3 (group 7 of RAMP superfamily)
MPDILAFFSLRLNVVNEQRIGGKIMILRGKLFAESPIYRGNARKTLFTRDGDGTQRLVSLAGEIEGTAQSLMDAFIGRSGSNIGLLNRMWLRLYGSPMPAGLITGVQCRLQEQSYPRDRFFDLRMGIKLDEDRWAAEANANYKIETLFRNSVFDIELSVRESVLKGENAAQLYYVLQELKEGRFWFGAGKSRGLGRCRLEMEIPPGPPFSKGGEESAPTPPSVSLKANHLTISLTFKAMNPILVGWNWGRVEPDVPAFAAIEGHSLIEAMRDLTEPVRDRLEMVIGGPILSPEDWKEKLAEYLPRVIAIWLRERSVAQTDSWILPSSAVDKLGKGRYPLSKKILQQIQPMVDQPFASQEAAEIAVNEVLGKKANMAKRVLSVLEHKSSTGQQFDNEAWLEVANSLGLDVALADRLADQIQDEPAMVDVLAQACKSVLPQLYQQVDRQIRLLQSDAWIDAEIASREEHIRIKTMLLEDEIDEQQWSDPDQAPEGISASTWREFIDSHSRVQFRHMLSSTNLQKSITNDSNFIDFLNAYRDRVRQELAQPYNTDFREGGLSNREISRKYGKPYDKVFMRMLSWAPSSQDQGAWEIYAPGSTIKGAFRKRASQVLKTLWGEQRKTDEVLNRLFGSQDQKGLAFFSDAYLTDPHDSERSWCSMDGVRMNPQTGQPVEEAKADYLFAYGDQLSFRLRVDMQDIGEQDVEALSLLVHLFQDFQRGDIPLGGEKTCGFGWVEGTVTGLNWMTTNPDDIGKKLFGEQSLVQNGVWHRLDLEEKAAAIALQSLEPLATAETQAPQSPPRASLGFISHRLFGGHCGTFVLEAEALTPISVKESGEPSFRITMEGEPVNGWDFFSMSPPENALRDSAAKVYALPSKSIKGMIRHIYSIASDSREPSPDISRLNPVDGLFGWVGSGQNQAIMGRLSFGFGMFEKPELSWFKVPYPYGEWQYTRGKWENVPDSSARKLVISENWRLFPHAPLAPIVHRLDDFRPDTVQASYVRAVLPGSRCRLTVRFWNLNEQELQRLVWCLVLEQGLAHKMGASRYLGFGSLRLQILPDSFFIHWADRYSGKENWRLPINVDEWINPDVIEHYTELRKALASKSIGL